MINHGTIEVENIDGNNNTNIKNGCYLKAGKLQFGTLVMGNTSEAICKELTGNGNDNNIVMEAQSMLTCTGKANYSEQLPVRHKNCLIKNSLK